MEGFTWLRVGSIAALFLGSIWILLPTIFRESAESRFAAQTESIEATAPSGPQLEVVLPIAAGDPAAHADTLEKRLKVAGIPFEEVQAVGSTLEVRLAAGGTPEAAERLARRIGKVSLHAPDAAGPLPAEGSFPADAPRVTGAALAAIQAAAGPEADYWAAVAQSFVGKPIGPDVAALSYTVTGGESTPTGGKVTFEAQPIPETAPFALVAVDGVAAGIALPDGTVAGFEGETDLVPLMASGPMPGPVGPAQEVADAQNGPEATEAGEAPVAKSKLPDWLVRLMPDTAIPLGLDLQGGIDLTLQVEVDEAVLGQVSRDLNGMKEAAQTEGLTLESVRRTHGQPVMELTTGASLATLQEFMRKRAPDYVYLDSEGTTHRFEMSEVRQEQVRDQSVEQVLDTLRKRIDATGVKDPSIVKKSGGRINIQLPGMDDIQAAVDAIGTTAVLEFRMVDHDFDDLLLDQMLAAAKAAMPEDQFLDDDLLNVWLWENKRLDEDRIVLWEYAPPAEGGKEVRALPYVLKAQVVLTGNDVNDAGVGWDQNQQPYVRLEFKPRGGQIFCDITGQSVGKQFAVILDDQVKSAPSIRERICGGAASIEMGGSEDPTKDAQTLALVLRTGALDAPVVIASKSQVGATLGADAIRQGTIAALLGSALVYGFMLLWYKTSGLIADIALTCNVLMVLASLGLFGATLTLPGIAGIALTVGMAVDANIIVYERIREELRLGVHPRKAVDVGFEKALVAILDANITTAIAGIVLYSYGTGPIKGFAVTLLVGIATTLVTAVFVTRTIMELMTRSSATRLRI